MEDLDPLGISQMRRFQRGGWTNRCGEGIGQTAVGAGHRRAFGGVGNLHRWPTPDVRRRVTCGVRFHRPTQEFRCQLVQR